MSHCHIAVYFCSGMTLKGVNHHSLTGSNWEVIKICYLSINNTLTINYEHFFLDRQHLYTIFQYVFLTLSKLSWTASLMWSLQSLQWPRSINSHLQIRKSRHREFTIFQRFRVVNCILKLIGLAEPCLSIITFFKTNVNVCLLGYELNFYSSCSTK